MRGIYRGRFARRVDALRANYDPARNAALSWAKAEIASGRFIKRSTRANFDRFLRTVPPEHQRFIRYWWEKHNGATHPQPVGLPSYDPERVRRWGEKLLATR